MKKKETFYGTDADTNITYLEFGSIDLKYGEKNIWDFRLHDTAYEWLMLARYANDMVTYINMNEGIGQRSDNNLVRLYNDGMHHRNDATLNLNKMTALAVMKKHHIKQNNKLSFLELGQTIFGCIDGMEFYKKFLKYLNVDFPHIDLKEVLWMGVDISQFFNKIAVLMHSNYHIKTMSELSSLPHLADVFFAKGVTLLYAVRTPQQLIEIIENGRLCIFDYSFSMGDDQITTLATGKRIKYISYKSFWNEYKKGKMTMYIQQNKSKYSALTNRLFIDCVYGEEKLCKDFIKLNKRIRNELALRLSSESGTTVFSDLEDESKWIRIEDFIDNLDIIS